MTVTAELKQPYWAVTLEEARRLYEIKIWDAKAYLLAIVKTHGASGWKWTVDDVPAFCNFWGIKERTFYSALSKLRSQRLVFWEAKGRIKIWWQDTDIAPNLDNSKAPQYVAEQLQHPAEQLQHPAEQLQHPAEQLQHPAEQKPESIDLQSFEESPRSFSDLRSN